MTQTEDLSTLATKSHSSITMSSAVSSTLAAPRIGKPWLTLVAAVLGGAMVGLDGTATTIAAPYISATVGGSLSQLELVANAYLVALAIGLLPAGRLADRVGRRKIFIIGVAGFGAASLAFAFSSSIWALVLFRVLQGFAGALLQPAALAMLRNAFSTDKLGLPLGIWGGANALAIGLGPVLAGVIVENWQWPAVFAVNGHIALIVIVLCFIAVVESKSSAAVVPKAVRKLFAHRAVSLGSILIAISSFGVFGLLFLLTLYLQNVHGISPAVAGMWMLPPTCAVIFGAPIGGLLAQRYGPRWPVCLGLALVSLGLLLLSSLRPNSEFSDVLYPGVLIGLGTGLCVIAATEAMIAVTPDHSTGVVSAVQQIASQAGGVLGIVSVGAVLHWQSSVALPSWLSEARFSGAARQNMLDGVENVSQGLTPSGFDRQTVGDYLARAARTISQFSFSDAMSAALLIASGVSFVGALLALRLPRTPHHVAGSVVELADPATK